MAYQQGASNPFELGDDQLEFADINTTYQPPDMLDASASVDAVVPAVPVAGVAGAAAGARAAPAPAVVPAAAPLLQFTDSNLNSSAMSGNIGRPAAGAAPSRGQGPAPSTSAPPPPPGGDDPSQYSFWNVRRYRQYFDVDTKDVIWRVTSSFAGPFKPDFMATTMQNPDMYGPFWVATTLVFVTAVAGNYADYAAFNREAKSGGAVPAPGSNSTDTGGAGGSTIDRQWYTDYAKMSYSALLFYGYVFLLGLVLYFALRWFRSEIKLVNVWCIYGYSLTIFIPVSFLCIIPIGWVRWLVVGLATSISGLFIVSNLKTTIYEAAPARAVILLATMLGFHACIGLALRLYFFRFKLPAGAVDTAG